MAHYFLRYDLTVSFFFLPPSPPYSGEDETFTLSELRPATDYHVRWAWKAKVYQYQDNKTKTTQSFKFGVEVRPSIKGVPGTWELS